MTSIHLNTVIRADIEKVFDLARNIDFHQKSTIKTGERAIAGKTSGLIDKGETVTWEAKHLGIVQTLTVKIIDMERPDYFTDVMIKGAFRSMKHRHIFRQEGEYIFMTDVFEFESPFGIIGKIFNAVFLKNYMKSFLLERNRLIKYTAESEGLTQSEP